ncbi:hypothetical protein QA596_03450 [Balneolales bacterium ANBcel1]|nr:hypothetical protein [Balneolales bacterium ANBcel1]
MRRCLSADSDSRHNGIIQGMVNLALTSLIVLFSGAALFASGLGENNNDTNEGVPGLRNTEWRDMLPHTKSGSYYNEFWVYHIFLEDDLHLHITFSLANFGSLKSAVSGGKLFVSNFKGSNYNVAREFALDRLVVDEERQKVRLHDGRDIFFRGKLPEEHDILFQTSKDGVSYLVELEFTDIHPGYAAGDGVVTVDGDEMGMFVHIPKARVTGTVAINEDTLAVSGTAYMDHTYQTDLSSKLVDKGFRHITHTNNGFMTGYYIIPKRRSETPVVGIALENNGRKTVLHHPVEVRTIESRRVDGNSIPGKIEITYASGVTRTLERIDDFQHVSFLEELGGLRRRLVRSFLGGEIIEYVGTGMLDNNTPVNYNFLIVH